MHLTVKQKIITITALASLIPIIVVIIALQIGKGKATGQVGEFVLNMGLNNLEQIAVDVYDMCAASNEILHMQLDQGLKVARNVLDRSGGARLAGETVSWNAINQYTKQGQNVRLPAMYAGNRWLGQNSSFDSRTRVVDEVMDLTDLTCTIFQRMNDNGDMLRVATNVRKTDGKRAIGTYIPHTNPNGDKNQVVQTVMRGETYRGAAFVVNKWYITVYEPIKDRNGRVIGILYVGVPFDDIHALETAIQNLEIGDGGYVFVMGAKGDMRAVLVQHPDASSIGKSLLDLKDDDGNYTFQEMTTNALNLKDRESYIADYMWRGEQKYAAVTYFREWDWLIGASITNNEFLAMQKDVGKSINNIVYVVIVTGLILVGLAVFVAFLSGNQIANPIINIKDVAENIALGDLSQEVEVTSQDEVGKLAEAFGTMTNSLRKKANVADQIAEGNLNVNVDLDSERDQLGLAMSSMKESLTSMLSDLNRTIEGQKAGDLEALCSPSSFRGAYSELLSGVNDALGSVINPVHEVIGILENYASGDLSSKMRDLPGKQIILTQSTNNIRKNLQDLIQEGVMLAQAAEDGNLSTRGDTNRFQGGYREIIQGMNNIIENLLKPVNAAVGSLEFLSKGDLTQNVTGDFKGDNAVMKNAINETLDSLNEILYQVNQAVEQVNEGAGQVSDSSQSLSQGATEQASSLEEITASMSEISSQTRLNAKNASEANSMMSQAQSAAEDGNKQMQTMLEAMKDINDSSNEISRIIKVIDEIAFQTNLLALNAAVEAARAGVHGKGFAVVAEEVRNLAQRSATAAKETTELIEGTVRKVDAGSEIANSTATALDEIVNSVGKISQIMGDIAEASNQQDLGIEQINEGLGQVDQVTQSNTANAEESAAAAQELSGQAVQLRRNIASFKLRNAGTGLLQAGVDSYETTPDDDQLALPGGDISGDDDDFMEF